MTPNWTAPGSAPSSRAIVGIAGTKVSVPSGVNASMIPRRIVNHREDVEIGIGAGGSESAAVRRHA